MARIEWDASLETGDAAVDHQHRAIHNLFNQLESSAGNGAECMRILDFLREWLTTHVHKCDRQLVDHLRSRGVAGRLPVEWIAAEDRASA